VDFPKGYEKGREFLQEPEGGEEKKKRGGAGITSSPACPWTLRFIKLPFPTGGEEQVGTIKKKTKKKRKKQEREPLLVPCPAKGPGPPAT